MQSSLTVCTNSLDTENKWATAWLWRPSESVWVSETLDDYVTGVMLSELLFLFFFLMFGPLIIFIVKLKLWDWTPYSYCEDPEGTSGPHGPKTCTWDLYPHPLPNPLYEIKLSKMKISIHLQSNLLSLISGYFWSFFAIPAS